MKKTIFHQENNLILDLFHETLDLRYNDLLNSSTVLELNNSILKINKLTDLITQRRHLGVIEDQACNCDYRNEFDRSLVDLEER